MRTSTCFGTSTRSEKEAITLASPLKCNDRVFETRGDDQTQSLAFYRGTESSATSPHQLMQLMGLGFPLSGNHREPSAYGTVPF